ncbi:ELYS protein, partial [Pterocles burchelli]|nr:ELYS protein [Pterocles burchelli]
VLSKIGEVWVGYERKTSFSQHDSPRVSEPPVIMRPLPDAVVRHAFIGSPVTTFSQKSSRLLDSVVRPVPSCPAAQGGSWWSPCRASTSFMASSPLKSNTHGSISQKNFSGGSELHLLETPLVVKNENQLCSALLMVTPVKLRNTSRSLGVFCLALTKSICMLLIVIFFFTKKVTEDDKALSGASSEHHHGVGEDFWSESRDKAALFTQSNPEDDGTEGGESSEIIAGNDLEKMGASKESNFSARSDQTTLEYHDAN